MKLRNFLKVLLTSMLAIFMCFALIGCGEKAGGEGTSSDETGNQGGNNSNLQGTHTIYLIDKPDGTWNIWAWKKTAGGDTNYDTKGWPGGTFQLTGKDDIGAFTKMDLDTSADLGILFVKDEGSPQTTDIIVPKEVIATYTTLYFAYGDTNYYTNLDDINGLKSAKIYSETTIKAVVRGETSVKASDFTITDRDGTTINVTNASISGSNVTLTISGADISKAPFKVTFKGVSIYATPIADLLDENFVYDDVNTLGLTIAHDSVTFKTWAPLASDVKLLIYENSAAVNSKTLSGDPITMTQKESGIWEYTSTDSALLDGKHYYQYRITNGAQVNDVADIWSYAASPDSVASQIIDINDNSFITSWENEYTNPFTGDYTDAVIYEMHIRDWAKGFDKANNKGKFSELTDVLGVEGAFAKHLKDLGITHVQILPAFDYAEKNDNSAYNWGYNPYHYNVPEGRYVKYTNENAGDGIDAVTQFRDLIKAFHDQGIAVIMDVVYNHTAGTGLNSLYDMTVPEYFYRLNTDGSYSNGSGCGNEVATNHEMVSKFVIESLKHWMNDYHINGFRFDLMGCHEKEFMEKVYNALYEIDEKVMVYGEPWTGGTALTKNGSTKAVSVNGKMGVGAFDDGFRNSIKGAEFGGFKAGQVQGKYLDDSIVKGLLGSSGTDDERNPYYETKPGLSIHYVECHDNYTLYDKLVISQFDFKDISTDDQALKALWKPFSDLNGAQKKAITSQNKLAAAFVFLAQGTPFINGGQEFMRAKQGDHNSYQSSDKINRIIIAEYMDDANIKSVYNVYKGLIAFRKAHREAFGSNTNAKATKLEDGITKYITGDFCVYFNATPNAYTISTDGYSNAIDVASGTPTIADLPSSVPATSFVILAK